MAKAKQKIDELFEFVKGRNNIQTRSKDREHKALRVRGCTTDTETTSKSSFVQIEKGNVRRG